MNPGFWFGLLVIVISLVIGAIVMRKSVNFRELVFNSWHAVEAFVKPFIKKTWFWGLMSVLGLLLGIWMMVSSLSG